MKLTISERTAGKKSEAKKLRREGNVPAVLYGVGQASRAISIRGDEFASILRQVKSGHLGTTLFTLQEGSHTFRAVIKEIHYHVVSYAIEHIDFMVVSDDVPVSVNVPIEIVGTADCAGVKLGGFLRQVIRNIKISCLPKQIPTSFPLDVRGLGIAESLRLSDLTFPAGVRPLARLNEVAVVVAKKKG